MKPNFSYLVTFLVIVTISQIACGISTPQAGKADAALYNGTQPTHEISTDVLMVVIAEKGVNVRAFPSENAAHAHNALKAGTVVTVDSVKVIGDSNWCHHQWGWSNCAFLKALEEGQ